MPRTETLSVLSESDLVTETGLPAREIHGRLVALSKAHHRVESALAFYLLEIERRALFIELGHASTSDYARECLGLEDRKTRTLLGLACRLERLPRMKEAFRLGELPYTKAREAVRVATPETDEDWAEKCKTLTNRQIEREVRKALPPERSKLLFFSLDESRIAVWERVREGMERLAGKTLTDVEVWDLICAEALCTYDTTPPLGDESAPMRGYAREVIERDEFRCTRPGCSNRSCLTANHIKARSLGGTDDPVNLHTVCIVCHHAIETGRLTVTGKAPDELTWEGPFGVIERPLDEDANGASRRLRADGSSEVREPAPEYGHASRIPELRVAALIPCSDRLVSRDDDLFPTVKPSDLQKPILGDVAASALRVPRGSETAPKWDEPRTAPESHSECFPVPSRPVPGDGRATWG